MTFEPRMKTFLHRKQTRGGYALNQNVFDILLKYLSFFLLLGCRKRMQGCEICHFPQHQVSAAFDKDSDWQSFPKSRSKPVSDCFNATSNMSLKTCSRLDVVPYCLYITKSV